MAKAISQRVITLGRNPVNGKDIELAFFKTRDLRGAPYNPRRMRKREFAGLKASLGRFGLVDLPVWNRRTKQLVAGHQRLVLLRRQRVAETPVIVVDLPEAEEKALNLTLNNPAVAGEWTRGVLGLLDEVKLALPDLSAALRIGEIKLQLDAQPGGGNPGKTDPDAVPDPPDAAVTQPGDLWVLGDHRLLCGDSSKAEDVDRLLDGARIHLVNTDPPYNVRVEPRSNNAIAAGLSSVRSASAVAASDARVMHHQGLDLARHPEKSHPTHRKMRAKDRPLKNDFVSDEAFAVMLRAWFGNIARVLEPGRAAYIWGGYANCSIYPAALKECGLYFSQAIIWVKEHPVLTRKDFMGNHEWCFYTWREGAAHWFNPEIHNATDVWSVKKVNPQSMVHLTEKPVELAVRAMTYSSRPDENVLDLFGGSGSTLIAAEKTGRKAFLMEIDDLYCDVIRQRWEEFTGKKAVPERA